MVYPFPLKIAGIGCYLPQRVVKTAKLESECGVPVGFFQQRTGISERRWVDEETQPYMGAQAAKEAIAHAGIKPNEIDLIIAASFSHKNLVHEPDGGALIQYFLGLGVSGIPSISIMADCQSFLAALQLSVSWIATKTYRNILIVSSEVISPMLSIEEPEAYTFFGDGAAAVVVMPSNDLMSSIDFSLFENYGHALRYIYSQPYNDKGILNGNVSSIHINGKILEKYGSKHIEKLYAKMAGKNDFSKTKLVIPQQLGNQFYDILQSYFGNHNLFRVSKDVGFCGSASYPLALYEAIRNNKLFRNEQFLLIGLGADLSVAAVIITY